MVKDSKYNQNNQGGGDILAVSMAPKPVLKGQAAKDLLRKIENPTSKKELFDKCKELGSVFKEK